MSASSAKDGTNIRGLYSGATFRCLAGVGAFCRAGLPAEGVALTPFVLAGNTLRRLVVDWVNRGPISEETTEAQYRVHVVRGRGDLSAVRHPFDEARACASYLMREVETLSEGEVELATALVPTTADPAKLDVVVAELERSDLVMSATWTVGATA